MNLHEYLFCYQLTAHQFAKKCDLSGSYICSLLRGDLKPSAKTMRIVNRVTNGKVVKIEPMPNLDEGDKAA
jgi:predicted transcriptional regulator